ncbi:hypothetical protein ONR57_01705 [Hoyosella sp. YIM 151337]|uniref:hypothetical protein n=1 Tax=Hoyosella sp. YIM 151337 TaxID=2992742 RepID=UPI00223662D0|nr:hypothetical protein [Hoyosella sp. YIM 151337]MCW4352012.1 hypothetical protein [Hoyosella sp. YIM 151337]
MSFSARAVAAGLITAAVVSASAVAAAPAYSQSAPRNAATLDVDGSTVTFTFHNDADESASCFGALQYFGLPLTQLGMPPVTLVKPRSSGTLDVDVPLPGVYRHVSACLVGDEFPDDPDELREHLVVPLVTPAGNMLFGDAGYIVVEGGHLLP